MCKEHAQKSLEDLIRELGDNKYATRAAADAEIRRRGVKNLGELQKALAKQADLEIIVRLENIIKLFLHLIELEKVRRKLKKLKERKAYWEKKLMDAGAGDQDDRWIVENIEKILRLISWLEGKIYDCEQEMERLKEGF